MFQAVIGVSGALSLAVALYLLYMYARRKEVVDVFVAVGLVVYLVLAVLLAVEGLKALESPLAAPLGALVPLLISLGVFKLVFPKLWRYYAVFVVIGIVAIAAVRATVPVIHSVAGLVIFLFPIYAVAKKLASAHFIGASLGGLTIGIGGVALASAAMARPILPLELVVALLPWILLLMVIFFAYGFALGRRR
jgi:hypothetical protein